MVFALRVGRAGLQHSGDPLGRLCTGILFGRRMWRPLALLQRAGDSPPHGGSYGDRIHASPDDQPGFFRSHRDVYLGISGLSEEAPGPAVFDSVARISAE